LELDQNSLQNFEDSLNFIFSNFPDLKGPGPYEITKATLKALTKKFSQELPPYVKINSNCPGRVKTRMGGAEAPR
jgi:NAD(P)-dependent dehydrogenase (short-subunit alcohol dehydrogenase family)